MMKGDAASGVFRCGLPFNRLGHGPRPLVVLQGLMFENKPLPVLMLPVYAGMYKFLDCHYTTYLVTRRPGLPQGCSLRDMADDYATMIREEFGEPIDVIGLSTGGSLCQHLAADHPDLVRRLVIHSSAYTLGAVGKRVQILVAHHARRRDWGAAYAAMFALMLPESGAMRVVGRPAVWLGALLAGALAAPKSPSDLVVTIEAEDTHDFEDRLAEITVPTLVVGGSKDPFYSQALFRDTAAGIPGARLIVYLGVGHPASGKQFGRDVLAFLREGGLDEGRGARPPRLCSPLPV